MWLNRWRMVLSAALTMSAALISTCGLDDAVWVLQAWAVWALCTAPRSWSGRPAYSPSWTSMTLSECSREG